MIYKFKSKAAGDVLMLGPNGDTLLRLIGREPAPQGIIEAAVMPAAIAALLRAVEDEAAQAKASDVAETDDETAAKERQRERVSLRQRVWPMVDMLRQAQAANEPIVWGV